MQNFLGCGGNAKKWDHNCDLALIKRSWGSVLYTYISELMLWLHRGKFMKVKRVKIPNSAAFQVANYIEKGR